MYICIHQYKSKTQQPTKIAAPPECRSRLKNKKAMENPFEVILKELKSLRESVESNQPEPQHTPGLDLDKYISLKNVCEMYGVTSQTLCAHKSEIDYVKRFGQIYFLKESLAEYMERGRPVVKSLFKTTRKTA
jgi:hypothetical protein